jgi:hypothetical protein
MHVKEIFGQAHVSFDCPVWKGFDKDNYFTMNSLDATYCFVLFQLRSSIRTKCPDTKDLNLKRRRLLIYIRRACRVYGKGRRLPLDVCKTAHKNRVSKLKGYTILG